MILVDTSVWVDHLRHGDSRLRTELEHGRVLCHPVVIGELALGSLAQRQKVLAALQGLPRAGVASHQEVLYLIERERLFGSGLGYSDAALIAAVRLSLGSRLWTRDKRLHEVCCRLDIAASA